MKTLKTFFVLLLLVPSAFLFAQADNKIYETDEVDEQPEFIGSDGSTSEWEFLTIVDRKHKAKYNNNSTIARMIFVVEKDGSLSNITASTLNNEAFTNAQNKNLLPLCPNWKPAKKNGKAVRCKTWVTIPTKRIGNDYANRPAESDYPRAAPDPAADPAALIDESDNEIHMMAGLDKKPQFPGGEEALDVFIRQHFQSPQANLQARVVFSMVVEKDGSLTDLKTLRTPSPEVGAEMIRVMTASPKWQPAQHHGKIVRCQFIFATTFPKITETPLNPTPSKP